MYPRGTRRCPCRRCRGGPRHQGGRASSSHSMTLGGRTAGTVLILQAPCGRRRAVALGMARLGPHLDEVSRMWRRRLPQGSPSGPSASSAASLPRWSDLSVTRSLACSWCAQTDGGSARRWVRGRSPVRSRSRSSWRPLERPSRTCSARRWRRTRHRWVGVSRWDGRSGSGRFGPVIAGRARQKLQTSRIGTATHRRNQRQGFVRCERTENLTLHGAHALTRIAQRLRTASGDRCRRNPTRWRARGGHQPGGHELRDDASCNLPRNQHRPGQTNCRDLRVGFHDGQRCVFRGRQRHIFERPLHRRAEGSIETR